MNSEQSRKRTFLPIAGAYFLGTFNDNFFKQAALVLAVFSGQTMMQGYALSAFTIPFIIFSSPAGWLSDRFPKRHIVIGAKWMELAAMLFGAIGICTGNWALIFIMLMAMGTQSAFFSPAINGSIPELFNSHQVTTINAFLRLFVTAGIFCGIALAGAALDIPGTGFHSISYGKITVAAAVILISVAGIAISYGVTHRPAAAPDKPFPKSGPIDTLRLLYALRGDRLLAKAIGADMFIWFAGSLMILLLNPLGISQLHLSKTMTSVIIVVQLLGLGLGGIASSRINARLGWQKTVAPCALLMGIFMIALFFSPILPKAAQLPVIFTLVAFTGLFGGMVMIPLESFIQIRPAARDKGSVWAAANCAIFCAILASGPLSNAINAHFSPTTGLGILGLITVIASIVLFIVLNGGNHE